MHRSTLQFVEPPKENEMKLKLVLIGATLLLAACAGNKPDPAKGEEIFTTKYEAIPGLPLACSACHSLGDMRPGDGPTVNRILEDAALGVDDMSPEEFLRQSIVNPSAYVPDGFFDNLMPKTYEELLTAEEIEHLVAYMLAQE